MGKILTQVSFWNKDMKVSEVFEASSREYFEVKDLSQFRKNQYCLYDIDDGTQGTGNRKYKVQFGNGDYFVFK